MDPDLPPELLSSILRSLHETADLLAARGVCRRWARQMQSEPVWQHRFNECCPFASSWAHFHNLCPDKFNYLRCFLRLQRLISKLQTAWTKEFRRSFQYGKYSRWVCGQETPEFILNLVFAARICGLCLPHGFLELDGASEREYAPLHSTSAEMGGGWNQLPAEALESLAVGRDAFLGLQIMHDVEMGENISHVVEQHLVNWWGGEKRTDLLRQLFDPEAFLALVEFVLHESSWKDDQDLPSSRLNSLFWDVHGLVVRGIDGVSSSPFEEFPITMEYRQTPFSNARQLPPLFNLAKLTEHVERLRATESVEVLGKSVALVFMHHG